MQYGIGNYCKKCNQRFYISGYQGYPLDGHVMYCPFCSGLLVESSEEDHRKFVYTQIVDM